MAPLRELAEQKLKELLKEPMTDLGSAYGITLKSFEARSVELSSVRWKDDRIEWGATVTGGYSASLGIVPFVGSVVGEVTLQQALSATTNYSLHSESRVVIERLDFTALALPVSKVGWLKKRAQDRLLEKLQGYASDLDSLITERDLFREGLEQQLEALAEGFQASSTPEVWLQVRPSALRVSRLRCVDDKFICHLGMDATVNAFLSKPRHGIPVGKVSMVSDAPIANDFAVNTTLHAGFSEWSALVRPFLVGVQQDVGFGTKVEITDAEIMPAGRAVAVRLKVESHGRINAMATLVLNGIPRFNAATKDLWLDKLDYDLQTKHLPVKTAELFLHEWLRKRVVETTRYNLSEELSSYKALANAEGRHYEVIPGIAFSGELARFDASELQVQPNGVAIALVLSGKGRFVVHKLPL